MATHAMVKNRLIVLVPIIAGLILRLIYAGGRSLRFEEGLIAQIVKEDLLGVIRGSTQNSTPVIFNLLVHFCVILFGSEAFVLTLVSILAGTVLIYVTYLFCHRFINDKIAFIAASFVAISPYLVYYSQEVRPYSLLSLFALCSAYFFLRALDTNKVVFWGLTLIFNILSVYTQPIGWLFVFAQTLYFFIFFKRHRQCFIPWLVTMVVVALYYLPQSYFNRMLVKYMGWHFIEPSGIIDLMVYTVRRFFGTIMHYSTGYYFYSVSTEVFRNPVQGMIFLAMAGIPAALLLLGLLHMFREKKALHVYLLLIFLAPVSLIWMDGTSGRYYVMGAAPFLIICAVGFGYLGRYLKWLAGIGIALITFIALFDIYTCPTSTFSPENPRWLSQQVRQLKQPGDVVYYIGGMNGTHTWKYYNPEPDAFITGTPFWQKHFFGIRPAIHPDEFLALDGFSIRIDPLLEEYDRIWMVMQGSRHRVVEAMTENLKQYYEIDLIYNQDWLALAEVRGKVVTDLPKEVD
jgi:hypothetical protein